MSEKGKLLHAKVRFLETALLCPQCNTQITDLLWFHWGYCASAGPIPADYYHIGDCIRWRVCHDGGTPAWTYFADQPLKPANIGDPAVRNILVQEESNFFWDPAVEAVWCDPKSPPAHQDPQKIHYSGDHLPNKPHTCPTCQATFAGAMIEIRDNIIKQAWIYLLGAFDHRIAYHIIESDGRIVPMPAWNNHSMVTRDTC